MATAKEILTSWKEENGFSSFAKLADFLGVKPNTIDMYKRRRFIPSKMMQRYDILMNGGTVPTPTYIKQISMLKKLYGAKTDKQLAQKLDIGENLINHWRSKKKIPKKYEILLDVFSSRQEQIADMMAIKINKIMNEVLLLSENFKAVYLKSKPQKQNQIEEKIRLELFKEKLQCIDVSSLTTIEQRIEAIRHASGRNIGDFCAILNISRYDYANLLKQKFNIPCSWAMVFNKHYGINMDWLYYGKGEIYIKNLGDENA